MLFRSKIMKHAVNDLGFVTECLAAFGNDFKIFVGLEELSYPMMAIGACGLMNAVGNLRPKLLAEMCDAVWSSDLVTARDLHQRLLTYTADAIAAFIADMERLGRADDVVMLVFTEFGRRVPENTSRGTDHGTAGPMFVIGKPVQGGHYGQVPSLTDLTEGDNLRHTTDFRRVYATVTEGWLGYPDTKGLLGEELEILPLFG